MDILLKNGTIVDGTGKPAYNADVYISGDKIELIDAKPSGGQQLPVDKTIDVSGKVVCPGFIDAHTHSDLRLLADPLAEGKVRQGVTTELLGLDGVSYAPSDGKIYEFFVNYFTPINGDFNIKRKWSGVGEFMSMFENNASVNVGYFLPHGNVRINSMENPERKATPSEISAMLDCVRAGMEEGALGLSTGLAYYPCFYGEVDELSELCSVVYENRGVFVTHMRKNKDPLVPLEESIEIGRRSGVPVHISHFRPTSKQEELYGLLERASADGIDISYDCYPYNASCSALWIVFPYWLIRNHPKDMLQLLKKPETRERLRVDLASLDWNNVIIADTGSGRDSHLAGQSILEASINAKVEALDFLCDLLIEENLNVIGIIYSGSEEDVEAAVKNPYGMFCSDGIITGKNTHPRGYGSFARILRKYVREKSLLSMEEAIRKMTSFPARRFKMKRRGELKTGYSADIVVFDPDLINDPNSYVSPYRMAVGVECVINNGQLILDESGMTGNMAGKSIHLNR